MAFAAQRNNIVWIQPPKPIVGNLDDVMTFAGWRDTFVFQAIMTQRVLRSKSLAH